MRKATAIAAVMMAALPASADTLFYSWMVAPPVVQAGDTFTVEVWLSMETTDFDPEGTFFGWATLSVAFGDDIGLIESGTEACGQVGPRLNGDVSPTGIWEILPWQPGPHFNWSINDSNPFLMFRFDITTSGSSVGVVSFQYAPSSVYDAVHFGWYLDLEFWYEGSVNTLETPNTYYQAEGVSVRVIPAPATALLALTPLAIRRRR